MPELRQNLATKEWVIISTERSRRPEDFRAEAAPRAAEPERSPSCPFCPGNEDKTGSANYLLGEPSDWKVRVVDNRYPALVPGAKLAGPCSGPYRRLPGEGIHEVVIESPSHSRHPALMDRAGVRDILTVYRERFLASLKDPRVALTLIFKNHGEAAGTSLAHPHSQLIGSSVVPAGIRHRMDEAQKHFEHTGSCVFCAMIDEESRQKVRLVADTQHFSAFVLFAALSPFHIWVLPKRHSASFGDITDAEIDDLAEVLRCLLKRICLGLGDPAYNYIIQSAPLDRGTVEPFHWYLSLVVRLSKTAGFELGSGMFINTALPEESARFLNAIPS